jgi:7,8-dihydroneopterin aldolase/epimerase/oxygenase
VSPARGDLDVVALRGLRVRGFHGVLPQERREGQVFVVDAVLTVDTRPAAASDDLVDAVDYADLAARLADAVRERPVDLLETLAARLPDVCLADARVVEAEVTVHKPEAPVGLPFADVSVTIRRGRG